MEIRPSLQAHVSLDKAEYGLSPVAEVQPGTYDAIIVAVAHRQFRDMGADGIHGLGKPEHIVYDLKYLLDAEDSDLRL